jgi:hypothetical protein
LFVVCNSHRQNRFGLVTSGIFPKNCYLKQSIHIDWSMGRYGVQTIFVDNSMQASSHVACMNNRDERII